jgi:hypothetical protein
MNEMKYIVFLYKEQEQVIVFSKDVSHKDMSRIHTVHHGVIVQSAGFVVFNLKNETATAYGESISIGIKSRPVDSKVLTRNFFGV